MSQPDTNARGGSSLAQLSATWRETAASLRASAREQETRDMMAAVSLLSRSKQFDERADELDACRGSLVVELQQIENRIRNSAAFGPDFKNRDLEKEWADQLADLRSRIGA